MRRTRHRYQRDGGATVETRARQDQRDRGAGGRLLGAAAVNWIGVPVAAIVKLLAAGTDAPYARMYQVPGAAAGTSNCGLAEPVDELAL